MKTACKRITSILLSLVLLLSVLVVSGTSALAAGSQDAVFSGKEIIRAYGNTRTDTSIAAAELLKKSLGVSKFDTIILSYSAQYADALSGSYLAYQKQAPILILDSLSTDSYSQQIAATVANYVTANLNQGGHVYILGGTAVVSANFETDLKTAMNANHLGTNVTRISGAMRYDTNVAILKECGVKEEPLVVCSGNDFADALSASALGYPILIVGNSGLADSQEAFLASIYPTDLYIIGGTSAVSDDTVNEISNALDGITPVRISGQNRYETSANIASYFFDPSTTTAVTVAWGGNFPDGLCAGPVAASLGVPMLLVQEYAAGETNAAKSIFTSKLDQSFHILAFGGAGANNNQLTDKAIRDLKDATISTFDASSVTGNYYFAAPTISGVSKATTSATVTWNAVSGAAGYECRLSQNKNLSNPTTQTTTGTSMTWSNLDKKTTYYVATRAYKTVNGVTTYSAWSQPTSFKLLPDGIRDLNPNKKMIALTYDDGPYTPVTSRILNVMENTGSACTFFVVGNRVSTYSSMVSRANSLGCEVANHTWDHSSSLTKMSASEITTSINKCNNAVYSVIGKTPTLVRPVGGSVNSTVRNTLNYPLIIWSVDTEDWSNRNASTTYSKVIGHVQDGDIVLMHDLYTSTATATEQMVPQLIAQGYQLVTIDELAYYKGVTLQGHTTYTSIR